jgi:glycosyltransferase involved in cell wall biosynthesis
MQLFKQILLLLRALSRLKFATKNKKSVLLVAEYGESGGTRTYFISLLKFLKEQGYTVTILDNQNLRDAEIETLVQQLQFNWHTVHFDFWGINFRQRPPGVTVKIMLLQMLKELLFWTKLLQNGRYQQLVFSVGYPGMFVHSIILPVRFLYIVHTPVLDYTDRFTSFWLTFFLSKRKQILTVSQNAKQDIYRFWFYGKTVKHVHYIHNYYSPKGIQSINTEKTRSFTVLTIGSLETYKNPFYFIEVAQKIIAKQADVKFIWAGDGSLMNVCKSRVAHLPLIQFIGNVNDVEKLYQEATLYFQPSLIESHGIATVGAMCFGLPCVVSNHGGLKESVAHCVNGYVVSVDNAEDTAAHIITLLQHPTLCREMGAAGKAIYKKMFTKDKWQMAMQKFLEK